MSRESIFQASLIREIKSLFRGCIVLKNDPNYMQGIPDILILYKDKWAALECKKNKDAERQPNQEYYVERLNKMSYASFVYPENREEVINGLQQAFQPRRKTRIFKP